MIHKPLRVIVLAGNFEEFQRYLHDNGVEEHVAIYAESPDKIAGIEADALADYGTAYMRKDYEKLREFALTRIKRHA